MRKDQSLNGLIELGKKGIFPLFERSWIDQCFCGPEVKKSSKQKSQVSKMILKLSKHKSIERKKTLLLALSEKQRLLFIQEFFKLVEGKILDEGMELH